MGLRVTLSSPPVHVVGLTVRAPFLDKTQEPVPLSQTLTPSHHTACRSWHVLEATCWKGHGSEIGGVGIWGPGLPYAACVFQGSPVPFEPHACL